MSSGINVHIRTKDMFAVTAFGNRYDKPTSMDLPNEYKVFSGFRHYDELLKSMDEEELQAVSKEFEQIDEKEKTELIRLAEKVASISALGLVVLSPCFFFGALCMGTAGGLITLKITGYTFGSSIIGWIFSGCVRSGQKCYKTESEGESYLDLRRYERLKNKIEKIEISLQKDVAELQRSQRKMALEFFKGVMTEYKSYQPEMGKVDKYDPKQLYEACEKGHLCQITELLVEDPKRVNDFYRGKSIFIGALLHDQFDVMDYLLSKDFSLISVQSCILDSVLEVFSNEKETPLGFAIKYRKMAAIKWLAKKFPSILDEVNPTERVEHQANRYTPVEDCVGWTPFLKSALYGNLEAMQWFYQQNPAVIEKCTSNGHSALHYAAKKGDLAMVEWLIAKDFSLIRKALLHVYRLAYPPYDLKALQYMKEKLKPPLIQWANSGLNYFGLGKLPIDSFGLRPFFLTRRE